MHYPLRTPKVFVPNKSSHDFSHAAKFGELVYITEGIVNRFEVNHIARMCHDALHDAQPSDYILISSLSVINSIACSIFSKRFGRLNLLLHDGKIGAYRMRSILIEEAVDADDDGSVNS